MSYRAGIARMIRHYERYYIPLYNLGVIVSAYKARDLSATQFSVIIKKYAYIPKA